ncbi:MAG: tail fiber domain-containing protein [Proteobacteria bacterium]|nr:tail fiber domain-containing protein [Pseudomonadota bacterium]
MKRDLAVIPDGFDKLLELHGYYYFWKDGSDQTRQVGVVAQEVEKILPELVRTGSDGIKTVDYPKLTAVLIEGTKQLNAEKDSEIAQLKARAGAAEAEAEAEAALLKRALCDKFPDLAVCSH